MAATSCTSVQPTTTQIIRPGKGDTRKEFSGVGDLNIQERARSVACLMYSDSLDETERGYSLKRTIKTLVETWSLAEDERFRDQPVPGFGTAFLVGRRWALTAGHCVADSSDKIKNCENIRIVFGFTSTNSEHFEKSDVYRIKCVVRHQYQYTSEEDQGNRDWALIELDREVEKRTPLELDFSSVREKGVYMWGHPSGLPMKYIEGTIQRGIGSHLNTDLPTFGGNSGSPAFDATTHKVCGILVRGHRGDYERRSDGKFRVIATDQPSKCQAINSDQLAYVMEYLINKGVKIQLDIPHLIKEDRQITNARIAFLIKKHNIDGVFSLISVTDSKYRFEGQAASQPVKCIRLIPGKCKYVSYLKATTLILTKLSKLKNGKPPLTFSASLVADFIFGVAMSKEQRDAANKELQEAYKSKRALFGYIARDGSGKRDAMIDQPARKTDAPCTIS